MLLLPLLFNFPLEYTIRGVQVNEEGLKLNGKHKLQVYVDNVIIFRRSIHTIKNNTEAVQLLLQRLH
jgi:hypothetical protein